MEAYKRAFDAGREYGEKDICFNVMNILVTLGFNEAAEALIQQNEKYKTAHLTLMNIIKERENGRE